MGIEQPSHPGISRVFMYSASLLGSYLESYLNLLLSELTERGKNPAYTPSLVGVISSPVHCVWNQPASSALEIMPKESQVLDRL